MPEKKLRIGVVDYRPSRAHATMFLRLMRERTVAPLCEVEYCYGLDHDDTRAWAEANSLCVLSSIDAMAGKVDGVMVPASSNPELHEELFHLVAPLKVPVFMDKPFADNAETARRIFQASRELGVPVMSSSALRFAEEVKEALTRHPHPLSVQTWGGWNDRFDEFVIHPVELLVSVMGADIASVSRKSRHGIHTFDVDYRDGRFGSVVFHPGQQPYEFTVADSSGWSHFKIESKFFVRTLEGILDFFQTGQPSPAPEETLAVMALIDLCRELSDGERREFHQPTCEKA